jgi:hypothetical protein
VKEKARPDDPPLPLRVEKGRGEANGYAKIRTAKAPHHRKGDADDSALAVEERSAGAARGGLRIVDNFVRKDVAHVALRNQRADQFALSELRQDQLRIATADFYNFGDGFVARAGKNRVNAGGVAKADERVSSDRSPWTTARSASCEICEIPTGTPLATPGK